jgi:hypothetical protein
MSDVPQHRRQEAAILARRKKARSVEFSPEAPCDWRPQTINDPETGTVFTPNGAWEFIAVKLEDENQSVREIVLRKPPGKKAFEMIVAHSDRDIYIKFQLGAGKIKGRSFHYSTRVGNEDT